MIFSETFLINLFQVSVYASVEPHSFHFHGLSVDRVLQVFMYPDLSTNLGFVSRILSRKSV